MENQSAQAPVYYSDNAYVRLNKFIKNTSPSIIFILTDSNTNQYCLATFLEKLETSIPLEIIDMDPGEEHKNIDTCTGIWNTLSDLGADRKSLFINLGGGVVTDLGGFVASTFKRGISYINIPTTLLSMVDASVGGKTGVDLGSLKNQIGVITQPEMVLIDTSYLNTLAPAEMRSGLAEILKHGLIASREYWQKSINLRELTTEDLYPLIEESVKIKTEIVTRDPREENVRKTLNFGHTFGHAIESYFLDHTEKKRLLHGEAVAAGMIIASFLSTKLTDFPKEDLVEITRTLNDLFPAANIEENDYEEILQLLKFDKKNSHGNINFVLLKKIGEPVIDCKVPQELLLEGLDYYKDFKIT